MCNAAVSYRQGGITLHENSSATPGRCVAHNVAEGNRVIAGVHQKSCAVIPQPVCNGEAREENAAPNEMKHAIGVVAADSECPCARPLNDQGLVQDQFSVRQ